ncbi:hypothetical protein [Flammeovirga kamogawensis]|uniref:Lipoprotein n=1 Tax=Flammeovirga kamogawensis TaxID=373891 RepID=A0ABX8GXY3_9BACT|nr:hypothetical protein [Flammeovirga kamogawensis]MBB6460926.1 hypothetical protein [Flammeovirga kamogawensis]QWG08269.1 hypothetical protein KM029_04850 [Flammeovirga kamogawensis]TRX70071.1 hypothetical protein EO216_18785 [Flammeovirga kamogawensis]
MKLLSYLLVACTAFLLSCETYSDPSILELKNTNIISSSNWSISNVTYTTNFDPTTRDISSSMSYGPGEVAVEYLVSAQLNGIVNWETNQALDKGHIYRYFSVDEYQLFTEGLHESEWGYRESNVQNTSSKNYQLAVFVVDNIRFRVRIYDDEPDRLFCYYDRSERAEGVTYKFHLEFWMDKVQ